jgi:hypothetical protein
VAAPIRIATLDAIEASDLVHALAARGLIGRAVSVEAGRWVEVREPREETNRLLADVTDAVSTWLAERERPSVDVEVEGRVVSVTARDDLRDVLRARLRVTARTEGSEHGRQPPPG